MSRSQHHLATLTAIIVCSLSAAPLLAQSAAGSTETTDRARALFKQAESAFGDSKFLQARALLLEAWSLSPSYDVAAALGEAELELKMYRDAAEHFDFALKHTAPTSSQEGIETVKKDLRSAKADVAELRISVNEAAAKVFLDGKEVGVGPLSAFVEPGEHLVEARLDERVGKKSSRFERGSTYDVVLVVPNGAGVPTPTSGLGTNPARDTQPNYTPPIVTAVAGGAFLVTGVVLVAVAASKDSKKSDLLDGLAAKNGTECGAGNPTGDKCKEIQDLSKSAATFKSLAIGSFVGAAAAGVLTYFLWPDAKKSDERAITVFPNYSAFEHSFQIGAVGRF